MASATPIDKAHAQATTAAERRFVRFNVHQRLQHGLMALSFVALMITGWPLRMAGVGSSQAIIDLFGSLEACGLVHRIAAVTMLLACIYHIGWVLARWRRRTLSLEIVPGPQDVRDLFQNLRYFLGRRTTPPKFGRWSYIEKFDYWAVFWGIFIMAGSGTVLWFPEFFASFLPAWVITVAHVAHSDEALLAGLAIFIWHFYNVHLRRHIFPMSWVWLTGELTEEQMKHEHALEYERILAREAAREQASQPADEPTEPADDDDVT
jgi:formate dehydrogenase subunit gamma